MKLQVRRYNFLKSTWLLMQISEESTVETHRAFIGDSLEKKKDGKKRNELQRNWKILIERKNLEISNRQRRRSKECNFLRVTQL